MKKLKSTPDDERLLKFLKRDVKECVGKDHCLELMLHADSGIHVSKLRHIDAPCSIHSKEFDTSGNVQPQYISTDHCIMELPIPVCDVKTIVQAKAALMQYLTFESQARMDNDSPRATHYLLLAQKMQDYLRKAITKRGRIRYLQDKVKDDYKVVRSNILYMLQGIYPTHPRIAEEIYSHIHFGTMMEWTTLPQHHQKPLAELFRKPPKPRPKPSATLVPPPKTKPK